MPADLVAVFRDFGWAGVVVVVVGMLSWGYIQPKSTVDARLIAMASAYEAQLAAERADKERWRAIAEASIQAGQRAIDAALRISEVARA